MHDIPYRLPSMGVYSFIMSSYFHKHCMPDRLVRISGAGFTFKFQREIGVFSDMKIMTYQNRADLSCLPLSTNAGQYICLFFLQALQKQCGCFFLALTPHFQKNQWRLKLWLPRKRTVLFGSEGNSNSGNIAIRLSPRFIISRPLQTGQKKQETP